MSGRRLCVDPPADFVIVVCSAQTFAACTTLNNIVTGTISGLLGMGFQTIASSGALPLVQVRLDLYSSTPLY